eukprot:TRINITY_DN3025_c0_g1_i10.p1 TRINITY_DN3025_c0_g1~~TRINITY_DN3025_c0_g1_i10.p1  ORF type:complete len:203 (+),score=25.29 TRINITY_DN3025_c0_g1_i10:195-803(+)
MNENAVSSSKSPPQEENLSKHSPEKEVTNQMDDTKPQDSTLLTKAVSASNEEFKENKENLKNQPTSSGTEKILMNDNAVSSSTSPAQEENHPKHSPEKEVESSNHEKNDQNMQAQNIKINLKSDVDAEKETDEKSNMSNDGHKEETNSKNVSTNQIAMVDVSKSNPIPKQIRWMTQNPKIVLYSPKLSVQKYCTCQYSQSKQ